MINLIYFYRVAKFFYKKRIYFVSKFIEGIIFLIYNSRVPSSCDIGKGTKFAYSGIGCVIHRRSVIGDNVMIGTNVTVGGKSNHKGVPKIGNNVYLATGVKVLGPIVIGDNVIIGANSVVIKSINQNEVWAGIPAKKIKNNTNQY